MKDWPRHIVALIALLLACFVIGSLFFFEVPERNERLADVAFGIVLGWGTMIVMFHFGSSQGSKDKTERLARQASGKPADPVHVEED